MKKLIALLAVLGMMFTSFSTYAGNAVTEASIVTNHTEKVTAVKTAVKNLVNVFGKTEAGKKALECIKIDSTPNSFPPVTDQQWTELKHAWLTYRKTLVDLWESLNEEELDLISPVSKSYIENMLLQQYEAETGESATTLTTDERTLLSEIVNDYLIKLSLPSLEESVIKNLNLQTNDLLLFGYTALYMSQDDRVDEEE